MTLYYITLPQLADKPGAVELAQVTAQSGQAPVSAALLEKVLHGEDAVNITQGAQGDIDKALQSVKRIDQAAQDAQSLIDGFLRQRGYPLPLIKLPRILTAWARAITRYYLHQHLIADEKSPIVRDYKDAMRLLQLVADGKFSLGLDDDLSERSGQAQAVHPPRLFTHETLRDY